MWDGSDLIKIYILLAIFDGLFDGSTPGFHMGSLGNDGFGLDAADIARKMGVPLEVTSSGLGYLTSDDEVSKARSRLYS